MASSKPYIFGLTEIDAQHQLIEDMLASLQAEVRRNRPDGALWGVLDRLYARLETHFAVEEAVLGLLSLSEAEAHLAVHAEILCLIGMCQRRIEDDDAVPADVKEWVSTIVELLHDHDAGFVDYLDVLRSSLARPCMGARQNPRKVDDVSHHRREKRPGRQLKESRAVSVMPG